MTNIESHIDEFMFLDLYEVLQKGREEPGMTLETVAQIINSVFAPEEREIIKKLIK